jgi:hypothetical protein
MPRLAKRADDYPLRTWMPKALALEAARIAADRDETVSQVVRRALREYVASAPRSAGGRQTDLEDAIALISRRSRSASKLAVKED